MCCRSSQRIRRCAIRSRTPPRPRSTAFPFTGVVPTPGVAKPGVSIANADEVDLSRAPASGQCPSLAAKLDPLQSPAGPARGATVRDAAGDQDGSDPDESAETARCPLPRQEEDVTQLVTVEQNAGVYVRGARDVW